MKGVFSLPPTVAEIYPNPAQCVFGTPAVVFRDHRWTLPIVHRAETCGLVTLPVKIITFDRHRDALVPIDRDRVLPRLRQSALSFGDLVNCVKYHLSPRDDDWIIGGMELGLISDVVQFGSECDDVPAESLTDYEDSSGLRHRIFHLRRPAEELSWKGALTDTRHEGVSAGLWDCLGWNPEEDAPLSGDGFVFDIDLDFFTLSWQSYTIAFTEDVFAGEFLKRCQSRYRDDYSPADLVRDLARKAGIVTIATEPQFCDGEGKAESIIRAGNRHLFGGGLDADAVRVDYLPDYPTE
jgi:hypothetical protein